MQAQLANWNPLRDVWETGQVDLLSGRSDVFSETLPKSGSMRSGQLFAPPTLEPPTGEQECSSSLGPEEPPLLRTPCAQEAGGGMLHPEKAAREKRTLRLSSQIVHLVDPDALPND